ncbi:MAG: type II toxin-antitoxin system RelE/ParE family toxin [Isosphaeraceae bacterium]
MPTTELVFYREEDGSVPALEWLDGLGNAKAIAKCRAKLERLAALGHELRRPEADLLRDGIYELRVGLSHINYRLLYFFSGKNAVIVSHGFTKEAKVPASEIALAVARRNRFRRDPAAHSYRE